MLGKRGFDKKKMRYFIIVGMGRSGSSSIFSRLTEGAHLNYWFNYADRFASGSAITHRAINKICSKLPIGKRKTWVTKQDYSNLLPRPTEGFRTLETIFGRGFPFSYGADLSPTNNQIDKFNSFTSFGKHKDNHEKYFGLKVTGPAKIAFWQKVNPDIKIVYLRRDPYQQIASHLNTGFWRDGGGTSRLWWKYHMPEKFKQFLLDAESTRNPEILLAAQWRVINEYAEFEISKSKKQNNIIKIDYQDYVSSPENCLKKISKFISIPIAKTVSDGRFRASKVEFNDVDKIEYWLKKTL